MNFAARGPTVNVSLTIGRETAKLTPNGAGSGGGDSGSSYACRMGR